MLGLVIYSWKGLENTFRMIYYTPPKNKFLVKNVLKRIIVKIAANFSHGCFGHHFLLVWVGHVCAKAPTLSYTRIDGKGKTTVPIQINVQFPHLSLFSPRPNVVHSPCKIGFRRAYVHRGLRQKCHCPQHISTWMCALGGDSNACKRWKSTSRSSSPVPKVLVGRDMYTGFMGREEAELGFVVSSLEGQSTISWHVVTIGCWPHVVLQFEVDVP